MTITTSTFAVKDGAAASKSLKALLDSSDTTVVPAHALVAGSTGLPIDPAVATGSVSLTLTPTVTAGAYTAGMVAGGKLSLAGAARFAGGSGLVNYVSVTKKTALTAPYDVYLFHTDPANSTFTDNAALALNVADIPYLVGVAHCVDVVSGGTPQTIQALNVGLPFKLAAGTTLFAVAVARGAETLGSTSALILNVGVLQD